MQKIIIFLTVLTAPLFSLAANESLPTPTPAQAVESSNACEGNLAPVEGEFFPIVQPDDSKNGLVTNKVDFSPEALFESYAKGIFPWADGGSYAEWFQPPTRGVLFLDEFHISSSLRKFLRKNPFRTTIDEDFAQVIQSCRDIARKGQPETWISRRFIQQYTEFHKRGHAHSVEVWQGENLVGGLYGVHVNGIFAGESMFSKADNASKVALVALVEHLKARGHKWIDTQVVTPILGSFGARTISREEHLKLLQEAQALNLPFK